MMPHTGRAFPGTAESGPNKANFGGIYIFTFLFYFCISTFLVLLCTLFSCTKEARQPQRKWLSGWKSHHPFGHRFSKVRPQLSF